MGKLTSSVGGGGGGGIESSALTATAADVMEGKLAGVAGSETPVAGTLSVPAASVLAGKTIGGVTGTATSDANGVATRVFSGFSGYANGNKISGSVSCNNIQGFSASVYSGRQILLQWVNPSVIAGRPFSAVFVNYATSGYPGTAGTRIYTGVGSNSAAGGTSQAIVTMPALSTTYYFSCTAYVYSPSTGEYLYGNTLHSACATGAILYQTFNSSTTYSVPAGYNTINLFAVGGGSSGCGARSSTGAYRCGGGGGGGYTSTVNSIAVSGGQSLAITIGAGGASCSLSSTTNIVYGNAGGTSSVARSGTSLISAGGGNNTTGTGSATGTYSNGRNGGSGGGEGGYYYSGSDGDYVQTLATAGGSNGGNGGGSASGTRIGIGQGTTTRAWGSSSGTIYAGGGGGGGGYYPIYITPGAGGSGGGGRGAIYDGPGDSAGGTGTYGTGGGGGGSAGGRYGRVSGAGGSGTVIIAFY